MEDFSWSYADTKEDLWLQCSGKGYVACPDGSFIYEPKYDGDGVFDGNDVFVLVALWNREFLATHPEYIIPHSNKMVKEYPWYSCYSDLSIPDYAFEDDEDNENSDDEDSLCDLSEVGFDLAIIDENNAALPYPIKITLTNDICYDSLPPSKLLCNGDYGYPPEVYLAHSLQSLADCILHNQGCEKCFIYNLGYEAGCHDTGFIEDIDEWFGYAHDYFGDEAENGTEQPLYRKLIADGICHQGSRLDFIRDRLSTFVKLNQQDCEKINALIKTRDRIRAEDILHVVSAHSSGKPYDKDKIQRLLDEFYEKYK